MRTIALLVFFCAAAAAQFTPAPNACAQAHCDSTMSDQAVLAPPLTIARTTYDATGGASIGLGCSTNNTIFACSFQTAPGLIAYDAAGVRICTSGNELDGQAYHSAPAIDAAGKIVAGDSNHIVEFDSTSVSDGVCRVVWRSAALNGSPVSPVFDPANNLVLGATGTGWVYAISTVDGTTAASTQMTNGGNTYLTTNTPCVANGAIFIVAQRSGLQSDGKLFGLRTTNLSAATGFPVSIAGPSYASPVCYGGYVIFDDATPSAIWISQANGAPAAWSPVTLPGASTASFALDPRSPASVWVPMNGKGFLKRLQISNGAALGTLTLYDANGVGSVPASALTISGPASSPYLTLGLTGGGLYSATMYDLTSGAAVWTLYADSATNGQFPVLNTAGNHVVAFTSKTGGAYFAAGPSAPAQIRGGATLSGAATIH